MLYFKILKGDTVVTAEAHEKPVYICKQIQNNILVRCSEPHAQGILSLDGSTVYQLDGKTPLDLDHDLIAYETVMTEYEAIINSCEENLDDDIPEDNPQGEDHIMTAAEMRAAIVELTEKVQELSERNEFFEDCLIEMSEVVYD